MKKYYLLMCLIVTLLLISFQSISACSLKDLRSCDRSGLVSLIKELISQRVLSNENVMKNFQATEIVSNNLPNSIEFWTQAYCPSSGNKYDYILSDSNSYFKIGSCSQGVTGSHGGCKTCIMSKIKLIKDQEKVNEEFVSAIKSSNIEKVKNLIKAGADVNIDFQVCPDINIECEETIPLYYASTSDSINSIEIVKELIKAGVDINKLPDTYMPYSSIVGAVISNKISIVRELIKAGAKLNGTLFHVGGNLEMAKELIKNGADINQFIGVNVFYALETQALDENILIFKEFIKAGANEESKGRALLIAARNGQIEIVKELIKSGVNLEYEESGITAFGEALSRDHKEVMEELQKAGAKYNDPRA
jgi:hypothetical protein